MDELVRGDGRKTGQRHAVEESHRLIITNDNPIINFFHLSGTIRGNHAGKNLSRGSQMSLTLTQEVS